MSEEKPVFKITDRRLFNADGSPRDVPREEMPAATAAEPTTSGDASAPRGGETAGASSARAGATPREEPRQQEGAAARQAQESGETDADPTPFVNLLMFIASPAAAALGMSEPGMPPHEEEIDLPLAQHCIDLLAVLRQKTRGNLGVQEEQILENLLAELRMHYVRLSSPRAPGGPRGFTGGDITGGR